MVKYEAGRRVCTAMGWAFIPLWGEECLSAYKRDGSGNPTLDKDYCAMCLDFPCCQKIEAIYVRKEANFFGNRLPKSMSEMEISQAIDRINREVAQLQRTKDRTL